MTDPTTPAAAGLVDVVATEIHRHTVIREAQCRRLAGTILAALDLPGREQALREAIEVLTEELKVARYVAQKNKDHYAAAVVYGEQTDAAHDAALTAVTDLLDEARTERDAARAEVAQELAKRFATYRDFCLEGEGIEAAAVWNSARQAAEEYATTEAAPTAEESNHA